TSRSPSRTTNRLPVDVEASAWVSEPSGRTRCAASRRSRAACATRSEPATTAPSGPTRAASRICEEISVRSASAWAASIARTLTHTQSRAHPQASAPAEVLRRPRDAPRRDDRVLRASLVRAADVPCARGALLRTARGLARRGGAAALHARVRVERRAGVPRLDRRLRLRRVPLPALGLHAARERRRDGPRRAPGRRARDGRARGELPDPPGLRAVRGRESGAPRVRRPRDPARLALRDGELRRLRRRGQLVAAAPTA